jgi:hypothetical protein
MEGRFFNVPLAELETPRDGRCICDAWWLVHPELGTLWWFRPASRDSLDYDPSPQCNRDRRIVDTFVTRHPGYEARQIPVAFMTHGRAAMKAQPR